MVGLGITPQESDCRIRPQELYYTILYYTAPYYTILIIRDRYYRTTIYSSLSLLLRDLQKETKVGALSCREEKTYINETIQINYISSV